MSLSRREFARRLAVAGALSAVPGARIARGRPAEGSARARGGIWKIIRNPKALESPPDTPPGETWRYMLSYPFQVAPTVGGLFTNLKQAAGAPGQDFEGGSDIHLFDRIDGIDARRAVRVSRNYIGPNPNNAGQPAIIEKHPGLVGFVPLGARNAQGRPHPHAGTGFALSTAHAWPMDDSEGVSTAPDRIGRAYYKGAKAYTEFEIYQLRYDGTRMIVSGPDRLLPTEFTPGYRIASAGMGCALADGDDLLTGLTGLRDGATASGTGMIRWRRQDGKWRPADFEMISDSDQSMEPSFIRDLDGSLLMHARAPRAMGPPVRIWRRAKPGDPWEKRIHVNGMIPSVPVTLNRAVDGTPFIVANLYQPQHFLPAGLHSDGGVSRLEPAGWRGERSTLCVWPLNEARDGFDAQIILRDPRTEFGLPPHGTVWAADHGTSSVVRLADRQWHALVGYRLLEWKENTHFIPPSPQTGSYLDEVVSFGEPVPLWDFGPES